MCLTVISVFVLNHYSGLMLQATPGVVDKAYNSLKTCIYIYFNIYRFAKAQNYIYFCFMFKNTYKYAKAKIDVPKAPLITVKQLLESFWIILTVISVVLKHIFLILLLSHIKYLYAKALCDFQEFWNTVVKQKTLVTVNIIDYINMLIYV